MSRVDDFMKRLHQQASGSEDAKTKKDKAIMMVIGSWAEKQTVEYLNFTHEGLSTAVYLGDHAKKAIIEHDLAWDCANRTLKKMYPQEDVELMKPQFDAGYEYGLEDEYWRDKHFKNVN